MSKTTIEAQIEEIERIYDSNLQLHNPQAYEQLKRVLTTQKEELVKTIRERINKLDYGLWEREPGEAFLKKTEVMDILLTPPQD